MRESLLKWVNDSDSLALMNKFKAKEIPITLAYQTRRKRDLYISLVGELFSYMKATDAVANDWAQLGNAFGYYADTENQDEILKLGINLDDAKLYAATAFYLGGFPASSYLLLKEINHDQFSGARLACIELLTRPKLTKSKFVTGLKELLIQGESGQLSAIEERLSDKVSAALTTGPKKWIPAKLIEHLVQRFNLTNLRAILPETEDPSFWNNLVRSFVSRGVWDFFPSQIHAINKGLLTSPESFSLQMPTGAGKTALCETLLYAHLKSNPGSAAVLLVPYRSLASELRKSVVVHLNQMGISARSAYGGTVPTGEEVSAIDDIRALIATPESLTGMLSANTDFAKRISLVICDEGHLLDSGARGVGLELLLAKIRARKDLAAARYVFASAIVPNIEEINAWLGGTPETVVRSDYRPAIAEFSLLCDPQFPLDNVSDLKMHAHKRAPNNYLIEGFLKKSDFKWFNTATNRFRTYPHSSKKSRAVAAARKTLPLGTSIIFSANKGGNQGVVGLVKEFVNQSQHSLALPNPIDYTNISLLELVKDYLQREYGKEWIGTKALSIGCVMHHGDIPQETREVFEWMLRDSIVKFGVCTSTLAEGVNLPVRTLVLYSVQRLGMGGERTDMLTRDIKNLVGRAGRAGSTTKGLVICANEAQWHLVKAVAEQANGDDVIGHLSKLVKSLYVKLALRNPELRHDLLLKDPEAGALIDGIDSTLLEFATSEIGEEELVNIATKIAKETFAAKNLTLQYLGFLENVFHLRAKHLWGIQELGQLNWAVSTGAKPRLIKTVRDDLHPICDNWSQFTESTDPNLISLLLDWALNQADIVPALQRAYRLGDEAVGDNTKYALKKFTVLWMNGTCFKDISKELKISIDDTIAVHTAAISYALQTLVEQGIALLQQLLESRNQELPPAITSFPEHLRFGVPTKTGLALAASGVRHRSAYVALGKYLEGRGVITDEKIVVKKLARLLTIERESEFKETLGTLVYKHTTEDLTRKRIRRTE
jgi:helicase